MGEVTIRPLGRPGDLGWVVQAHGELYATETGWGLPFEALVARIVADFAAGDDPRTAAWIAELDDRRVGCVFCTRADEETAQLRVMLVHPDARGHGLGTRRRSASGSLGTPATAGCGCGRRTGRWRHARSTVLQALRWSRRRRTPASARR